MDQNVKVVNCIDLSEKEPPRQVASGIVENLMVGTLAPGWQEAWDQICSRHDVPLFASTPGR